MKRDFEQISSEWLVIQCQSGKEQAFELLAAKWYPKLQRFARAQLKTELAEEAVQNTFLYLIQKVSNIREPAAFPCWVYRVLQGQITDLIRKKQKEDIQGHETEAEVCMDSRTQDFEKAIRLLPGDIFQTVHLFYLEGFNVREVANIQAIPEGTVKSRLYTAREQLKCFLAGDDHD